MAGSSWCLLRRGGKQQAPHVGHPLPAGQRSESSKARTPGTRSCCSPAEAHSHSTPGMLARCTSPLLRTTPPMPAVLGSPIKLHTRAALSGRRARHTKLLMPYSCDSGVWSSPVSAFCHPAAVCAAS